MAKKKGGRKTAKGVRKASKARSTAPKRRTPARKSAQRTANKKTSGGRKASRRAARKASPARRAAKRTAPKRSAKTRGTTRAKTGGKKTGAKMGGSGRESTLAQTPGAGRSVRGPTNPMPTKRSTGTAAGAGDSRRVPALERERKQLRELEESVPQAPSSLNMDRHGSAARTGRANLQHLRKEHTETGPAMTGGDVDADWEDAYAVGDEAPGGDNPTPGQDRVDDIGRSLGIEYQDNEELKGADKITRRDKHRWELDPASAEDYPDHDKD